MTYRSNFIVQKQKVYVYRFDCEIPQAGVEKYINEQIERSSEYRFMTDEFAGTPMGLENVTLINALESNLDEGKKFDILEGSKYRLSVYLSKLASRLARYPQDEKCINEVEKIHRYFKGGLLIKNYHQWERILSIYVLVDKKTYFHEFADSVRAEIDEVSLSGAVCVKESNNTVNLFKQTLLNHLDQSVLMAESLCVKNKQIDRLYIDTYMVRMNYNIYPLQEFCSEFIHSGVRLPQSKYHPLKKKLSYDWMPYYVRYCDIVCFLSLGGMFSDKLYKEAYEIYRRINHIDFRDGWRAFLRFDESNPYEIEFNTSLSSRNNDKDQLTLSLAELQVSNTISDVDSKYGNRIDYARVRNCQLLLDNISKVFRTDLFIMPELSLPIYELREFCLYSATREIAFVSGLEYFVSKNKTIHNYTITCLPIVLFGKQDAVPVIRPKNHYAPFEKASVKRGYKVSNDSCWQVLYHWKGHTFTTYYCYELTSIIERSHFFGKVDAIYCPVYNPDTYYFNNIAESCSRDMHCYFTVANDSYYGDSRVTKPAKHDRMNMLKVTGGNTEDNPVVVLSCDLDIKGLRNFQKLPIAFQIDKDNKTLFKPTPPGFDISMVDSRNEHFMLKYTTKENFWNFEAFYDQMVMTCLKY